MLRSLLAMYGLIVALVPKRVIEFWEARAFESTGEAALQSWIVTAARLEGLALLFSAISDETWVRFRRVLGIVGLPALLAPNRFLQWGLKLAYINAEDIEIHRWVTSLTRVLGFVYVLAGLGGWVSRRTAAKDEQ